jgi:hypothetical protein
MTQEQAAVAAGVRKETVGDWLRDNKFTDELRLALERMRQTFEARVMGLANNAAVVVGDMIADDKDKERQLEGAKLAFNAAVRLSNRYKELQVEGYVAPAQPLVVFPSGTRFPWQNRITAPPQPLEIPEVDIENEARNLLESYSPLNGCGTGEAFTNAVEKAVRYLLLKEDGFVENIANALEKRIEKQKKEEMKASIIEEIKPLLFDDFKAELERYAAHIEIAKAQEILGQTTTYVIPEIPTNNIGQ